MLTVVTGGADSGKSLFAEQIAIQLHNQLHNQKHQNTGNLYYFATMQLHDEECRERVRKHRNQRAGKGFQTIETPFLDYSLDYFSDYPGFRMTKQDTGLLECVSNLLANLQFDREYCQCRNITDIPAYLTEKILYLTEKLQHLTVVTNMISSDRIPQDADLQSYLQNLGMVNCRLAEQAEAVIELQSGIPVIWKGKGSGLFHEYSEAYLHCADILV